MEIDKIRSHGGLKQFLHEHTLPAQATVLDFSVNINPYGPSPKVLAAVRNCDVSNYPEPQAESLKAALTGQHRITISQDIIICNGAIDFFWSYAQSQISPQSRVLILEPGFSEFRLACVRQGARIWEWRAKVYEQFRWDFEAISRNIGKHEIEHVYLCHPNSPTGVPIDLDWLERTAESRPKTRFILDLAFVSLSQLYEDLQRELPENVIKVCSLTKDHSIPGLRLGYAIAPRNLVSELETRRAVWSINAAAIAAGLVAVNDDRFLSHCRELIFRDTVIFKRALSEAGLRFHLADAPMILIHTGSGQDSQQKLWGQGILVRDCASYQLAEWIRVFPRPAADSERLIQALQKG